MVPFVRVVDADNSAVRERLSVTECDMEAEREVVSSFVDVGVEVGSCVSEMLSEVVAESDCVIVSERVSLFDSVNSFERLSVSEMLAVGVADSVSSFVSDLVSERLAVTDSLRSFESDSDSVVVCEPRVSVNVSDVVSLSETDWVSSSVKLVESVGVLDADVVTDAVSSFDRVGVSVMERLTVNVSEPDLVAETSIDLDEVNESDSVSVRLRLCVGVLEPTVRVSVAEAERVSDTSRVIVRDIDGLPDADSSSDFVIDIVWLCVWDPKVTDRVSESSLDGVGVVVVDNSCEVDRLSVSDTVDVTGRLLDSDKDFEIVKLPKVGERVPETSCESESDADREVVAEDVLEAVSDNDLDSVNVSVVVFEPVNSTVSDKLGVLDNVTVRDSVTSDDRD